MSAGQAGSPRGPTLVPAQVQRVADLMLAGGLLKTRLDVQPLLLH